MIIKLTKEQKKNLKSIEWLYNGGRASGRTTLLAYVLIKTVLSTQQSLRIIDHFPSVRADKNLADIINLIIEQDGLPLQINQSSLMLIHK